MRRFRLVVPAITCLYFFATLQFIRYYCKSTDFYLNMPAYLSGHERLPFQERVLPILFLAPIVHSQWITRHLVHSDGAFTAERGAFYVISLFALLIAGVFTQKLYRQLSESHALDPVVYPIFLFLTMWSYSIHSEANFSYPYDMLSLAFFTAGIYFIFKRRFVPLTAVIFLGTFNRETTLFLIGIYVLDSASIPFADPGSPLRERLSLRLVSGPRVALLGILWLSIKLSMAHLFAHNDSSENYVRILYNVGLLRLRLIPALLNMCGYALPIVILLRTYIRPVRFANYLYVLPLWFAVMFYSGVIVETRIYGELCSFVAIALVLIIERHVALSYPIRERQMT